MSSVYDRRWELNVDGETIIAAQSISLKCDFNIIQEFGAELVLATINIYNLSKNTVSNKIAKKKLLSFSAGYVDNLGVIFTGVIVNTYTKRIGADKITTIIATSGNQLKGEHSIVKGKSFKGSNNLTEVLKYIAEQLGYSADLKENDFKQKVNDYSLKTGDGFNILMNLAGQYQFDYVLEGETLVFIPQEAVRSGTAIEVSKETGMEDRPTYTDAGYNVTVRLNPKIKIGGTIKIKSKNVNYNFAAMNYKPVPDNVGDGEYKVYKIVITGDTHGDDWSTHIEGFLSWNG